MTIRCLISRVAGALLLLGLIAESASAQTVTGKVDIVNDGDTFRMRGANGQATKVRLFGVDAPESSQSCKDATGATYTCGKRSGLALISLLMGKQVTCTPKAKSFDRIVAVCTVGIADVSASQARDGWGVAYTSYSLDYLTQANDARAAGRGIWAGTFDAPECYRHPKRSDCACIHPQCDPHARR